MHLGAFVLLHANSSLLYQSALTKLSIQVGRASLSLGHILPEEDEGEESITFSQVPLPGPFCCTFLWRDFKFSSVAEARLLDVESVVLHFRRLSAIDVGVCVCVGFFFFSFHWERKVKWPVIGSLQSSWLPLICFHSETFGPFFWPLTPEVIFC